MELTFTKILEMFGAVLGITGTVLLSTKLVEKKKVRLIVFILYLISNVAMVYVMFVGKMYWAMGMQTIYFFTSLNGIRTNL